MLGITLVQNEINISYNEDEGFGPSGSELAYRIMELAPRSYLLKLKTNGKNLKLGDKFRPIYFGHLFLNAWNADFFKEALEHWNEATFRLCANYIPDEKKVNEFHAKIQNEMSLGLNFYIAFLNYKMWEFGYLK